MARGSEQAGGTSPLKPATLLAGFAILVACQLAGEIVVLAMRFAFPAFVFPGPVVGMLILFCLLGLAKRLHKGLDVVANGLIGILSLLFVPSAVGIVQYADLIAEWGGPLLLAVLASTVLTLVVTVGTYLGLARLTQSDRL